MVPKRKWVMFGAVVGLLLAISLLFVAVYFAGWGPSIPGLLLLGVLYAWIIYAFVEYRQARQQELLQVLASTVEARLPLAPVLRAYLEDRPNDALYHFWVGVLLNITVAPYFWIFHELHRFDQRIAHLADELASGETLAQAMRAVPAVANRETRVAADIGEATGNLAACLRSSDRERLAGAWLELVPRLVYPFIVFVFMAGTLVFFLTTCLPRIKRIFWEFKLPLPQYTLWLAESAAFAERHMLLVATVLMTCVAVIVGLFVSPNLRWRFPVIGRLYHWDVQSLVLRSMGAMLGNERTVPQALSILREVTDLPEVVRQRLAKTQRQVEAGESLAGAMCKNGLIPASMSPLLLTAERTHTLPWTLTELGELQAGKALRLARRLSLIVAPLLIIGVGLVLGVVVMGLFTPLISLIEALI